MKRIFNMAQSTGSSGGKSNCNNRFLAHEIQRTTHALGFPVKQMPVGKGSETRIKSKKLLFQMSAYIGANWGVSSGCGRKKRKEGKQTLISNLYFCLGRKVRTGYSQSARTLIWGDKISTGCESDRNRTQQRKETYETS